MVRSNHTSTVLSKSSTVQEHVITMHQLREPLLKRPLDMILSAFMLILFLPVSLPIAFAIKMEDAGPVFYRQERWGKGGTRFRAYKFRTMVGGSDREEALEPGQRVEK